MPTLASTHDDTDDEYGAMPLLSPRAAVEQMWAHAASPTAPAQAVPAASPIWMRHDASSSSATWKHEYELPLNSPPARADQIPQVVDTRSLDERLGTYLPDDEAFAAYTARATHVRPRLRARSRPARGLGHHRTLQV